MVSFQPTPIKGALQRNTCRMCSVFTPPLTWNPLICMALFVTTFWRSVRLTRLMGDFPVTFSNMKLPTALMCQLVAPWGSTTQTKEMTLLGLKNTEEFCELSLVAGDNGSKGACAPLVQQFRDTLFCRAETPRIIIINLSRHYNNLSQRMAWEGAAVVLCFQEHG